MKPSRHHAIDVTAPDAPSARQETDDRLVRTSLFTLTWPILVENLLRTSFLSLDTLMLSNYSEHAVAAMSLVHTFGFFIQLLYLMVGVGVNILISQNLGANKDRDAGIVAVGGLVLIVGFSSAISLVIALFAEPIVALFSLDPLVHDCAVTFIRIYGGGSLFLSLNIVASNILRSFGHSRDPMMVNIITLGVTVLVSLAGLFGPFHFSIPGLFSPGGLTNARLLTHPELVVSGITWVAFATLGGQLAAAVTLFVMLFKRSDITIPFGMLGRVPAKTYRSILRVGVPTAGETLSYNLAHLVILAMIATMGTEALAAYGILIAVLRYVFITAVSIGLGTQIKVGYFVGAHRFAEAHRRVFGYFAGGFVFTLFAAVTVYLFSRPIAALFSEKESILTLSAAVFFVAIFHEPGRSINTIVIPALKGAGDVIFPVIMGLLMMWGIGVLGAWFLGVRLGLGLVGIWIGLALDEWVRGIVMLLRWRSRAWVKYRLV